MKRSRLVPACVALTLCALAGQHSSAAPRTPTFGTPVQVTPANAGGYEPGIYTDRFGNLYATAHKENHQLPLAPDSRNPTQTRSMSWAWLSADNGKTWQNLPTGPAGTDVASHSFGDEGDMATDDAGNLFFADTNVADISFTAWHASGRGTVSFTRHWPTVGFGEPMDDRPWLAAHLDGHVFYFGNEGDKQTYPLPNVVAGQDGSGVGPGRYTVYASYDGGQSWDHIGIQLKDSGWCRPAAAPRSRYVYAMCTDDSGHLYSYVSPDDGKTWNRYDVARYTKANGGFETYPSLQVLPDGTVWGFYLNPTELRNGTPAGAKFLAFRSVDHGRTWRTFDITPAGAEGQFEYGALSVASDGKTLGYAVYHRQRFPDPWKIYAAVFPLGQRPRLVSLDPQAPVTAPSAQEAPADFLMAAFDPSRHLNVAWTRFVNRFDPALVPASAQTGQFSDIYTARSR